MNPKLLCLAPVYSLLIVLGGFSSAASAQEDDWKKWPLGSPLTITGGVYSANLDTVVRLDASDGLIGTRVDFEQNLGMNETKALPVIKADWRFARRHQLSLGYFELKRSGAEVTETTIRFGDTEFQANLPVSSFFDVEALGAAYQYSLIFDRKKELALGFGLAVQDMHVGIRGNPGGEIIREESDFTAPLPTFGLSGAYAFTDKWIIQGAVGLLAVELELGDEENLEGSILDAGVALYHQTFEHVRFGLGYAIFDLDVNWIDKGRRMSVHYTYHGPNLSVGVTF